MQYKSAPSRAGPKAGLGKRSSDSMYLTGLRQENKQRLVNKRVLRRPPPSPCTCCGPVVLSLFPRRGLPYSTPLSDVCARFMAYPDTRRTVGYSTVNRRKPFLFPLLCVWSCAQGSGCLRNKSLSEIARDEQCQFCCRCRKRNRH